MFSFTRKIVRTASLVLAAAMIISSTPSQVFADPNNTAGNTGAGGVTNAGGGTAYMGWYVQTQGYRFYIVNKNLERITPVYDFYGKEPERFYKSNSGSPVDYRKATRFDVIHSPSVSESHEELLDKLYDWCSDFEQNYTPNGKAPNIYVPNGKGGFDGNGENFKDWFFAGAEGLKELPTYTTIPKEDDYEENTGGSSGSTGSSETKTCSKCEGTQKIDCPTCKGTGTDSNNYIGKLFSCDTCLGAGTLNCTNCVSKISCNLCGRTMTAYGNPGSSDNKCYICISNTWIECDVCGEKYDPKSACISCEINKANDSKFEAMTTKYCPICGEKLSLVKDSTYNCSKCNKNITYKDSTNTIRISVPDSYWLTTSELNPSTQQNIKNAKQLISTAENYSAGNYYWNNQPTLGALRNNAKEAIKSYFNKKMIIEEPISPNDALLYATGRVWTEYQNTFTSSTTTEHKQAVAYVIYEAMTQIKNSASYQNLYYTEQSLSTRFNNPHFLLSSLIPLSGEGNENKNKFNSPIEAFISGSSNIKFTYPDPTTGIQYESAAEAIQNGCYLVVEPLIGVRIHKEERGSSKDDLYTTYWVYGTYWNIAQEEWASDGFSNWYSGWITSLAPNALVTTNEVAGIKPVENPSAERKISKGREMMGSITSGGTMYGLSMHIYDNEDIEREAEKTQTYDPELISTPGASPDDTKKLTEEQINKQEYSNIVKFYVDKSINKTEVFVREQVPTIIQIMDEEETTGYILKDWFTSDELYDGLNDPGVTYERTRANVSLFREWSSQYEGHKDSEGKQYKINGLIGINNEDFSDNTLYLLLEKGEPTTSTCDEELEEPGPSPDDTDLTQTLEIKANIVKFYETIDQETEEILVQDIFVRKEVPTLIEIEDEANTKYKVKKRFTSYEFMVNDEMTFEETASSISNLSRGSGATEEPINIVKDPEEPTDITLYVQLQKVEETEQVDLSSSDWILEESEISKAFETGTKTTRTTLTWNYGSLKSCGGHRKRNYDSEGNVYYTTRYCSWSMTNSDYTFKLKNSNEVKYKNVIAIGNNFKTNNNSVDKNRSGLSSGSMSASGFNYQFVAHRGDDKLTLASYINTDKTIEELGYTSADSKSKVTRKIQSYSVELPILLVDNSTDKYTSSSGSRGCSDSDTARTSSNIKYNGEVGVKVYSGKQRTKDTTVNASKILRFAKSKVDMTSGRQIASGAEVKFNPYIRMTYRTLNDTKKKDVYVLGEYRRTIVPNDYAEIEWKLQPENLKIQSQMWATDKSLTDKKDKLDWTDNNQVLKGGASYQLVANANQEIKLNTYQTIVSGDSREISDISGNYELSYKQAKEEHKKFKDEAIKTLEGAELAQYVNPDPDAEYAWEGKGIKVYSGANISKLKNGSSKASPDSKYYLESDKDNNGNLGRADLDIREKETTEEFYRFYSDTSGNIYVVTGENITEVEQGEGTKLFNKKQDMSLLRKANEKDLTELQKKVIDIDDRTSVVTKLIAAIERNTGNDTTASWASSDGKWYNEAFNGVIVIVQKTTIEVGLGAVNQRTAVIDPKLVPQMNSKVNEVEAFLTQFKVDFTEKDKVATFKGQEVFMYGIENLFTSQKVYIPNMTVQDNR